MAFTILSSIRSLATKLADSLHSSPSSSSSSSPSRVEEDLDKLQSTLPRIQAVLTDAEKREITDESVKLWLKELKGVAYDAEDLLEEYHYELLHTLLQNRAAAAAETCRKRKREEEQVCDLTSTLSQLSFPQRIRKLRGKFDDISKDRLALQLREEDGIRQLSHLSLNPQQTSSHVDESAIFGREKDKERVIEMFLSEACGRFCVIPIVGMAGVGKATLAQFVYNDPRVQ